MIVAGIIILAIGSVGVISAVILEMRTHEPCYKLLMKIFPWLVGMGGLLIGLSL